jgi:hypothetical protein
MGGEMKEKPDDWGTLCKRLKFSRTAFHGWRKLPGAPQTPDAAAWKAFIAENDLGIVGNRVSKDREELIKEKLTKENRLLDLKIAKEEKTSVDRKEVDALFLHIATLAKTTLYPALERELPPKAEGRTAAEISLIGREMADKIVDQMQRDMEAWAEA